MQRLTENDGKGNWQLKGLPWEELAPGKELTAEASQLLYGALRKLKDLEDAGLHPKSAEAIDWLYLEKCKEVNELKKKMKWIPVKERLPESPAVLFCTQSGSLGAGFYINGHWRNEYEGIRKDVVAWMPLPDPYRPEGSEP